MVQLESLAFHIHLLQKWSLILNYIGLDKWDLDA